jgi:hypothetical protein
VVAPVAFGGFRNAVLPVIDGVSIAEFPSQNTLLPVILTLDAGSALRVMVLVS